MWLGQNKEYLNIYILDLKYLHITTWRSYLRTLGLTSSIAELDNFAFTKDIHKDVVLISENFAYLPEFIEKLCLQFNFNKNYYYKLMYIFN